MQIYEEIQTSILNGEVRDTIELTKKAIALKYPLESILSKGLVYGIEKVIDKYKNDELLIPEILISTRAVHAGFSVLNPYFKTKNNDSKVKIVMGVVEGDIHDIGKDLVKMLLSTLDVCIIDLGVDVKVDKFIEVIEKEKPHILVLSTLLTTTLQEIKSIMDQLSEKKLRDDIVVFVGGAPVCEKFRKDVGADYYKEDALELREFLRDNLSKILKNRIDN